MTARKGLGWRGQGRRRGRGGVARRGKGDGFVEKTVLDVQGERVAVRTASLMACWRRAMWRESRRG